MLRLYTVTGFGFRPTDPEGRDTGLDRPGCGYVRGMVQTRAISLSFGSATDDVPRIRRFVARWLQQNHVSEPARSDLLLAVAEAINNACQHPSPQGCSIHISCSRRGRRISVSVSDAGGGFSVDPTGSKHEPPLDRTEGRGLFLMRHLTDEVIIKTTTRGTTVTLVREITPEPV